MPCTFLDHAGIDQQRRPTSKIALFVHQGHGEYIWNMLPLQMGDLYSLSGQAMVDEVGWRVLWLVYPLSPCRGKLVLEERSSRAINNLKSLRDETSATPCLQLALPKLAQGPEPAVSWATHPTTLPIRSTLEATTSICQHVTAQNS
jgi:hypothetical protein